jgi:hypothetical protein
VELVAKVLEYPQDRIYDSMDFFDGSPGFIPLLVLAAEMFPEIKQQLLETA